MGWHRFTGKDPESFDLYTKEVAGNGWRFLILDGHYSHITIEFIEYCEANRIALYCPPPHSTHILQQLDIDLFRSLLHHYSKAIDDNVRRGVYGIHKGDFLPLYLQARQATYLTTIIKAFETCGPFSLNARVVLKKTPNIQT